jgi:hypothetical protein
MQKKNPNIIGNAFSVGMADSQLPSSLALISCSVQPLVLEQTLVDCQVLLGTPVPFKWRGKSARNSLLEGRALTREAGLGSSHW